MPRKKPLGEVVRKPEVLTDGSITIRVVGSYYLSEEHSAILIEMIMDAPWYVMRDFAEFSFYAMPAWGGPPVLVRPQFFFNSTGEELVGSYLHLLPELEEPERPVDKYRRQVRMRFAFFVDDPDWGGGLHCRLGPLPEPDWEPIPERLLRLIWLEL